MLSLNIEPDKSEYILQESINLELQIANDGPEAVELPDPQHIASAEPSYGIMGPAFPEGKLFSNLSLTRDRKDPGGFPAEVPAIRIEPGATWSGSLPLSMLLDVSMPGEYRIRSVLNWQGGQARSQDRAVRVNAAAPQSIHLGTGTRPWESGEGRLVFVQKGAQASALYAAIFREDRPDIGEMDLKAPVRQRELGASATDVGSPWRNSPFFSEFIQWTTWREGREIKAIHDATQTPKSVSAPVDLRYLVSPPLKTKGGPVEVLAVGADDQLYLASFPGDLKSDTTPRIAWSARMPARPAAMVAALGPEKQGSERHVAGVSESAEGLQIFHAEYRGDRKLGDWGSAAVKGYRLMKEARPALFVDAEGKAAVTVLAVDSSGGAAAIEARFSGAGALVGEPAAVRLGQASPEAGAVLYLENGQREIVVIDGGSVMRFKDGQLARVSVQGTPTQPILLSPGKEFTYILYFDAKRGFYFEPL